MRMTWLADRLRDAGLRVVEHDGWETRGRHMTRHNGTVVHHTGSANDTSPQTEARILRDGHSRLAGPLAHLGLRRDGTFDVIAAGRCNHAGTGQWPGLDGNDDCIGIELYGRSSWPQPQLDALVAGCAVLQAYTGLPADRVIAHREWAPGRKVDPAEIDMDRLRRDVETKMGDDMPDEATFKKWVQDAVFKAGFGRANPETFEVRVANIKVDAREANAKAAAALAALSDLTALVQEVASKVDVDDVEAQRIADKIEAAASGGMSDADRAALLDDLAQRLAE